MKLLKFGKNNEEDVTQEELRNMVSEGQEQGVLDQAEADMISNIFEFSEKEARDIMTHRGDMITIDASMTLEEAVHFMLSKRNSRFPVFEENIDHIIGIVHRSDAVKYREDHPEAKKEPIQSIEEILRAPVFVPETKNIDDLFSQMQKGKQQMVIVIDEYGKTEGLIAMEDILEEIVGNILDEYDLDENHISATSNKNEFILDGRTRLEEMEKRFGLTFEDDRYETLNGFMISQMDRIPEDTDHFTCEYQGFRFHILTASRGQVKRLLLTRL